MFLFDLKETHVYNVLRNIENISDIKNKTNL